MTARTYAAELIGTVREILGNNRRLVTAILILAVVANVLGYLTFSIPTWWPVAAAAVGAAVLGGRWAAQQIQELLPDPEGILIIAFDAGDAAGGQVYELSEAAFADLEVEGGDLFQWPGSPRRVYEVRSYDPVNNVARANWRENPPGSTLAEEPTVEDALEAIREIREDLEPHAREGRLLKRRIRGIVRQLDRERAEAMDEALDEHAAPALGDSRSVGEIIDEMLPDDLHPERSSAAERTAGDGRAEASDEGDDDQEGDDSAASSAEAAEVSS